MIAKVLDLPGLPVIVVLAVSSVNKQTEGYRFSFLFAANKRKMPFSLIPFSVHIYTENGTVYMYMLPFQTENARPAIFLHPFTICSSCKRKFDVCQFVDQETIYT